MKLNFFNFFVDVIIKGNFNMCNLKDLGLIDSVVFYFKNAYYYKNNTLNDMFVTDYLFFKKRFRMTYNFNSSFNSLNFFLNVSLKLLSSVVSLSYIFRSSVWIEREIFDMFGIKFINNWDMRRILTDYTFFGFPLRKDFPLSGYMELIYDEKKMSTSEVLLELMQEMRFFSVSSHIEFWDLNLNLD